MQKAEDRGMRDNDIETIDVAVEIRRQSALAWLVSDGDEEVWIPKSQIIEPESICYEIGSGHAVTITIPGWLAREKGLI